MFFKQIPIELLRDGVMYFLVITAILATIFYRKYNDTFLKYFVFLIWYNVANEFFARYYSAHIAYNNMVLYNIYRVVEFSFYFLLYQDLVIKQKHKKIIRIFFVLYLLSVVGNCFVDNFFTTYFANTFFVGALFIIISIMLYFSEILNSEKIINVTRLFSFWISIAVFMQYTTTIPFKIMMNYYQNSPTIPYIYASNYLVMFIFYLIISIGLFWTTRE